MDRGAAMVSDGWAAFSDERARWRDAGRSATFWWRDDDAVQWTSALARLVGLAGEFEVPLALAVVPAAAQASLFDGLPESVCVLQHGVDHRDRSRAGTKRSEFSADEPAEAALARIAEGRARLEALAGRRWSAAFAPPWNRVPAALAARLPSAGLRGLSAFGARARAHPAAGLTQVNTHVDLIAWRGNRGFVGVEAALAQAVRHLAARRRGEADPDEPTGWLTHHLQHDAASWDFLARLLALMRRDPAVRWLSAQSLFAAQQT